MNVLDDAIAQAENDVARARRTLSSKLRWQHGRFERALRQLEAGPQEADDILPRRWDTDISSTGILQSDASGIEMAVAELHERQDALNTLLRLRFELYVVPHTTVEDFLATDPARHHDGEQRLHLELREQQYLRRQGDAQG